jgi:hypothetical protein
VLVVAVASLVLSGCSETGDSAVNGESTSDCAGVSIVIDYGPNGPTGETYCVEGTGGVAADVVASVGVTTEGTAAYGDLVVCRVNNYPPADAPISVAGEDPYTETCEEMPPAFAYWALWIKRAGATEWGYAEEGVGTLEVSPGDALGFVFSTGSDTPTPDSTP